MYVHAASKLSYCCQCEVTLKIVVLNCLKVESISLYYNLVEVRCLVIDI